MDDLISRKQAIDAVLNNEHSTDITLMGDAFGKGYTEGYKEEQNNVLQYLADLPSAQPEIIYCKDCVKHNKGLGNYEVHPDGSTTWIWKDSACPLVSWRDKAQGHEFDYQFCAYAERREVTE